MLRVCLAGATGWAGSELARAIAALNDLSLVAAVSRQHAAGDLGEVLGVPHLTTPIYSSATKALADGCDVFVEYTKPEIAKANILTALEHGAHVVVGTSGLTDDEFAEIEVMARKAQRGVLACGNFALTAVLLQKFAVAAAKLIPQWEIIDYAADSKVDAPAAQRESSRPAWGNCGHPNRPFRSSRRSDRWRRAESPWRGHKFTPSAYRATCLAPRSSSECPTKSWAIRHDAGSSARPYVDGALLAIRKVSTLIGLHRGLESVLDL